MTTEELIKELVAIEYGEGEFPLPDTMIDDIIEKLKDREERISKNKMTVARTSYWADMLSKCIGNCRGLVEEIIKEVGGEVVEE